MLTRCRRGGRMDKREFKLFSDALRTYYPKENILPNDQAMELWYRSLSDIEYQTACAVLGKWVMLNKWSPSIAEIREQCVSANDQERKDWSEGWADVLLAVRKYGWAREKEALASLDPVTSETCRRIGWMNICSSENISIERASFRTIYGTIETRQHEEAVLSPAVKSMLSGIKLKSLTEGEA